MLSILKCAKKVAAIFCNRIFPFIKGVAFEITLLGGGQF